MLPAYHGTYHNSSSTLVTNTGAKFLFLSPAHMPYWGNMCAWGSVNIPSISKYIIGTKLTVILSVLSTDYILVPHAFVKLQRQM